MRDLWKRVERVRAALAGRERGRAALVFADGTRMEGDFMELFGAALERGDLADVLAQNETARSLLLAITPRADGCSELEELAGQQRFPEVAARA